MQLHSIPFKQAMLYIFAFWAMGISGLVFAERSGEEIFNTYCVACHTSGLAGAPILGNPSDWQPRAQKGMATLLKNATNGMNAMPPKGLCFDCSDDEMQNTIQYIIDNSQG